MQPLHQVKLHLFLMVLVTASAARGLAHVLQHQAGKVDVECDDCRLDPGEVEKKGDRLVWSQQPEALVTAQKHKMSKSRGNVVNPDDVVFRYGADSLRLYEMFLGPLQDTKVLPALKALLLIGCLLAQHPGHHISHVSSTGCPYCTGSDGCSRLSYK